MTFPKQQREELRLMNVMCTSAHRHGDLCEFSSRLRSATIPLIDALDEAELQVDSLAMFIRMIQGYPKTRDKQIQKAVDYLVRNNLQGSVLRDADYEPV